MVSYSNVTVTDEGDYTKVTVPPDTSGTVDLNDNDVWENIHVDITSSRSRIKILGTGADWTIRNVGIEGQDDYTQSALDDGSGFSSIGMVIQGDCLIENVYYGDGAANDGPAGGAAGAMWLSPSSASGATLTVREMYVADWPDNGFYCSSDHGGNVHFYDCYARNCGNANFRVGNQGDSINNCSSILTGDPSGYAENDSRGVWGWYNYDIYVNNSNVHAENNRSAFWAGASGGPGTTIHVNDTSWIGDVVEPYGSVVFESGNDNNSSATFVPSGCPTSPSEAYLGTTTSDPSQTTPIEDFERTSPLDDYSDLDGTAASVFDIVTGTTYAGTGKALHHEAASGDIIVRDAAREHASRGDEWQFHVRTNSDTNARWAYWFHTDGTIDNGYELRLAWDNNFVRLDKEDNGTRTTLQQNSVTLSANEWYRVVIDMTTGDDINVDVYTDAGSSVTSMSVTDGTHDSGQVMYEANGITSTSDIWFDEEAYIGAQPSADESGSMSTAASFSGTETATIIAEHWVLDSTELEDLQDEKVWWNKLSLTYHASESELNNIFDFPYAGQLDTYVDSDGVFHAIDKAGGQNTYTLSPPQSKQSIYETQDWLVEDVYVKSADQTQKFATVRIIFVPKTSTSLNASYYDETPASNEWLFDFSNGSFTTTRVAAETDTKTKQQMDLKTRSVVMTGPQFEMFRDHASKLESVRVRELPDQQNVVEDTTPNKRVSFDLTQPSDAGGSTTTYYVMSWDATWIGGTYYDVRMELASN